MVGVFRWGVMGRRDSGVGAVGMGRIKGIGEVEDRE